MSSADKRAQQNVAVVDAFVASQDIAKGTTGENAVGNGLITAEKVLRGSIPPAAVTDTSFLKGKVAAPARWPSSWSCSPCAPRHNPTSRSPATRSVP